MCNFAASKGPVLQNGEGAGQKEKAYMSKKKQEKQQRTNPFFLPYDTPHETVPFHLIRLEDYKEAFLEGIRREDEDIENMLNEPGEPTFDNTIAREDNSKGENYYDLLGRVSEVFSNMLSAETCDELDDLAEELDPILTKHANDISLNPKLFERTKHIYDIYKQAEKDGQLPEGHRPLTSEEKMLLEDEYEGFVRSGALLDEEGKGRLRRLTEEASMLTLQFSQNLLKENKAFKLHITNKEDLDGLPQSAIDAAALAAKEQKKAGWLFTLDYPSFSPFMTYSTRRALRKKMYMAKNTVCIRKNKRNNSEICKRLVNLRREVAQLLGYKTYADYVLKKRMATNKENVYKLLYDLIQAYKPKALEERKEVEEMFRKDPSVSRRAKMEPWDYGFYSHRLQLERYNLDSEMLRPYFQLDKVIEGVFGLANRLYGITFQENKKIPVYHPDVKAYEVFDKDGSYLAVFYADFHPRKGKQGGAWMTEFQGQWVDSKGRNIRPHVSVVMNLTKPTAKNPALLTLGEVETFLHEFGHALHGMFANTEYEALSGTNVWWDFVELPSQFMENYSVERDFLRTFAFHYKTGEPLPDELIDRIIRSRNFMVASGCLRQVSFGLLDMAYYTQQEPFDQDILSFEKQAWADAIITPQLPNTCMTVQFSHIMAGGYAAGYYSYKWAEVLDADAFSLFKRNGIFDQATAQSFRDNVLSKGGTEHPMTLYKRFRGQEPTIDALLERNGIKKETAA